MGKTRKWKAAFSLSHNLTVTLLFQALSEGLRSRRNSLDNLDSLYQRLQERDSLTEDDKKKIQQELNNIKNNWNNLEELIHETHTKYALR